MFFSFHYLFSFFRFPIFSSPLFSFHFYDGCVSSIFNALLSIMGLEKNQQTKLNSCIVNWVSVVFHTELSPSTGKILHLILLSRAKLDKLDIFLLLVHYTRVWIHINQRVYSVMNLVNLSTLLYEFCFEAVFFPCLSHLPPLLPNIFFSCIRYFSFFFLLSFRGGDNFPIENQLVSFS